LILCNFSEAAAVTVLVSDWYSEGQNISGKQRGREGSDRAEDKQHDNQ